MTTRSCSTLPDSCFKPSSRPIIHPLSPLLPPSMALQKTHLKRSPTQISPLPLMPPMLMAMHSASASRSFPRAPSKNGIQPAAVHGSLLLPVSHSSLLAKNCSGKPPPTPTAPSTPSASLPMTEPSPLRLRFRFKSALRPLTRHQLSPLLPPSPAPQKTPLKRSPTQISSPPLMPPMLMVMPPASASMPSRQVPPSRSGTALPGLLLLPVRPS